MQQALIEIWKLLRSYLQEERKQIATIIFSLERRRGEDLPIHAHGWRVGQFRKSTIATGVKSVADT